MIRSEDSLSALDLRSWGVLEVKLLEKRLRASDLARAQPGADASGAVVKIGNELKEVQKQCQDSPYDGASVAMTILRFTKDPRVALYACVLLEGAMAGDWSAVLPERQRRELKELLVRTYDYVEKLEDKADRDAWQRRIARLQRLVEERRTAHSPGEAPPRTSAGRRGPETSLAKAHVRSSSSLSATALQGRPLAPRPGANLRRLAPAGSVGIGGEFDVPKGNWWNARCLEHFPGRPRPMLRTTASATFFGGSQYTVLEPADRKRLEKQMRCTFSTF